MPLKVNGATIPYSLVVPIAVFTAWLGGLSYQVNANAEDLEKKADTLYAGLAQKAVIATSA